VSVGWRDDVRCQPGGGQDGALGILSTLARPSGGNVRYRSHDAESRTPTYAADQDARALVARCPAVRENLKFFAGLYGVDAGKAADRGPRPRQARPRLARASGRTRHGAAPRTARVTRQPSRPPRRAVPGSTARRTRSAPARKLRDDGAIVVVVTHAAIAGVPLRGDLAPAGSLFEA
jgi:hypothetical protein